ncbi:MAG: N-acetylmuramoyl-L-alanine amidase [Planctomycetota bacterium]
MSYRPIASVDWLVIHCSATSPSMDIGVEEVRQWHLERGWADVGYHFVIRRNGNIERGRDEDRPGAHAGAAINKISLGICLIGGSSEENIKIAENNFTDEQWATLAELIAALEEAYPNGKVIGHRDIKPSKACPSFDVDDWYQCAFGRDQSHKE